jgi:hypothetical protein
MRATVTIYVPLLDEGVAVWRPVDALHKEADIYTITSANLIPDDERWQFTTGQSVRCRQKTFADAKTGLEAYDKI